MFVSEYGVKIAGKTPPAEIETKKDATEAFLQYVKCRDAAADAIAKAMRYTPGVSSHDKHMKRSWAWDELSQLWENEIMDYLERVDYPDPEGEDDR